MGTYSLKPKLATYQMIKCYMYSHLSQEPEKDGHSGYSYLPLFWKLLASVVRQQKERRGINIGKEEQKWSFVGDEMIILLYIWKATENCLDKFRENK